MKKTHIAAVAVATAMAVSPAAALAAAPSVVEQGKAIYIEGHGACTIGYNDAANHKSYTAGHCGSEGARVSLLDRATMEFSEEMGTFHPSKNFTRLPYNDWGWIEWDQGVQIAGNSYSGDRVLTKDDVKIGWAGHEHVRRYRRNPWHCASTDYRAGSAKHPGPDAWTARSDAHATG